MKKEKIDKTPARLDFIQSVTGVILAIFIMGHLLFEATILISHEAMYRMTIFFEGYYFFGETYPGIISFLAGAITVIMILHIITAMRKFPSSYKKYKLMKDHMAHMKHEDTSLWMLQVITGFLMFFTASVHLYIMMTQPSNIGPYASSHRIVDEMMGPLYLLLLISVVLHAFVGLYRVVMKWGFMEGENTKLSRKRFKKLMYFFIVVYMLIGLASLAKYTYIGLNHDFSDGVKYKSQTINLEAH